MKKTIYMYSVTLKNLLQYLTRIVWFQQISPTKNVSTNTSETYCRCFFCSKYLYSKCKICCLPRRSFGYFLCSRLGEFVAHMFLTRSLAWFSNRALYLLHKRPISSDVQWALILYESSLHIWCIVDGSENNGFWRFNFSYMTFVYHTAQFNTMYPD